jgi:PBP1b-binding outer membrane lipoprotein LpoB
MKSFLSILTIIILLASCQSKTEKLLIKKWDCVKVDNLDPIDTRFQTPKDSIETAAVEAAMKSLSWTFNKDGTYNTYAAGRMIVQGIYFINEKEKTLKLITGVNNNTNYYTINALSENEMVLSSEMNRKNIVLHFLPSFQ